MLKMEKHIFRKAAVLGMLFSVLLSATVFAASGKINFSDPAVSVGEEVNVTMKISADEGTALTNANVVLKYPSDKLEFISGTDADGGAGAIRVHGTSNGGGTALLEYNLRFRTSAAGTFNVSIDSYEVYDDQEQPVEFVHLGNSAVTVNAAADASSDSTLQSLDVYPGQLDPGFDASVSEYQIQVGPSVDKLTISAFTTDEGANVRIDGNENFQMGDNTVTVTVVAADGNTSQNYILHVTKSESGAESGEQPANLPEVVEGVQLSSKGKTITIMNPAADVHIPEGFKQGTIKIDEQKVQGWVWGADEEPQYCVVYGMNDKGELNFYRYDMLEKTIQRYFEDPIAANAVSSAEFAQLQEEKEAVEHTNEIRFLLICILAVFAFVLLMLVIYLTLRNRSLSRSRAGARRQERQELAGRREQEYGGQEETASQDDTKEFLKHDYEYKPEAEPEQVVDETQVIRRPERRRRSKRNAYGEDIAAGGNTSVQPEEAEENEERIEDLDI